MLQAFTKRFCLLTVVMLLSVVNALAQDVSVAQIGDVKYATLQEAFNAAQDGETVTLLDDYDATGEYPFTAPNGNKARNLGILKGITFDGASHTLTVKGNGIWVGGGSSNVDVTFENITIVNTAYAARCIDTRGKIGTLTLNHVTLNTQGATSGYTQPLTIGGNQSTEATVNITNSTIQTNDEGTAYYAIVTFNPVDMTIEDSTIKGWACIYAKGPDNSAGSSNSTFAINNSTLVSSNAYSGVSNSFAAFVMEDNDVTVSVTNSKITLNNTGDQTQAIAAADGITGAVVNLGAGNEVKFVEPGNFKFAINDAEVKVSGGEFNVEVPEDCCAEGYIPTTLENGKYSVKQGSFVAQIDDVKYETLAEAFAAANETTNATITLLSNCETGSDYTISNPLNLAGEGTVLDLNEKTLTVTNNFSFCVTADNVTVKNGTIVSAENTEKATNLNSYILVIGGVEKDATISGVTIENVTTQGGISVGGDSDAGVKGIAKNTVIKDCDVLSGDYYAVCSQNESTVTINGGKYTANTASTGSKVLYAAFKGHDGPEGKISVVAGTFTGAITNDNTNYISISGGTYNVEPTTFVATGFKAVDNGNGTWTVKGNGEEFNNDVKDENNTVVATETVTVSEEGEATITKVEIAQEGVKNVTVSAAIGSAEVTTIADDAFKSLAGSGVQTIDLSSTKVELSGSREGHAVLGDIPATALVYLPSTSSVSGTNVVIKKENAEEYTCASLVMQDQQDYSVPTAFTAETATLNRSFTADVPSTLCLPYNVPAGNITGKIYRFASIDLKACTITMTEDADGLDANVPYIFMPNAGTNSISASNIDVEMETPQTTQGTFTFVGVFEKKEFTDDECNTGVYGYAGQVKDGYTVGQFAKGGKGAYVAGMRAYLIYTGGESLAPGLNGAAAATSLPSRFNVQLQNANGETTEILNLDMETAEDGSPVYNLSGQRVNNAQKGIYIKNGKKVIIK